MTCLMCGGECVETSATVLRYLLTTYLMLQNLNAALRVSGETPRPLALPTNFFPKLLSQTALISSHLITSHHINTRGLDVSVSAHPAVKSIDSPVRNSTQQISAKPTAPKLSFTELH